MCEKIIINENKKNTIFLTFFSLVFVCFFGFFLIFDFRTFLDDPGLLKYDVFYIILKILFFICGMFCLLGLLYFIKLIFNRKPLLIVDDKGINDNSSFMALGFVPWKDIKNITFKGSFIIAVLTNPEIYLSKQNFIKVFLMKVNKKLGFEYICISPMTLKVDGFKLLSDIRKFYEDVKNNNLEFR